jgi:hypothetical protein
MQYVTIAPRFCGPPGSANGGYACGLLAQHADTTVRVRLEKPVPLGAALQVHKLPGSVLELRHDGQRIALAEPDTLDMPVPTAPGYLEAIEASRHFIGFTGHAFPGCFVCGPERARGDGLRIFAGACMPAAPQAVPADASFPGLVASPWIPDVALGSPDRKVRAEFMWAALDCPGYFAARSDGVPMLLGAYTAHVDRRVHVDEPCVVVGWRIGSEGRKHEVGTALYDADGNLCARARALWIEPRKA